MAESLVPLLLQSIQSSKWKHDFQKMCLGLYVTFTWLPGETGFSAAEDLGKLVMGESAGHTGWELVWLLGPREAMQ